MAQTLTRQMRCESPPPDQVPEKKKAQSQGLGFLPFWLARPEGFEPPTPWFVARYSIQMSYGRVVVQRRGRIIAEKFPCSTPFQTDDGPEGLPDLKACPAPLSVALRGREFYTSRRGLQDGASGSRVCRMAGAEVARQQQCCAREVPEHEAGCSRRGLVLDELPMDTDGCRTCANRLSARLHVGAGEGGAKQQDQRGVVHPHQHQHQ